jgi:hypothetical protein
MKSWKVYQRPWKWSDLWIEPTLIFILFLINTHKQNPRKQNISLTFKENQKNRIFSSFCIALIQIKIISLRTRIGTKLNSIYHKKAKLNYILNNRLLQINIIIINLNHDKRGIFSRNNIINYLTCIVFFISKIELNINH